MKQVKKNGEEQQFTQIELEEQAANTLLNNSIGFDIDGLGHFEIKALKLATQIRMSKHALKIETLGENATALNVIGSVGSNAIHVARIVSLGIVGNKPKRRFEFIFKRDQRKVNQFAEKLIEHLSSEELHNLFMLIIKNSNPAFFLACTNHASQLRMMKPKTNTKGG